LILNWLHDVDGKKGVHTATPHPSKHAGKNPANIENSKSQTPKSGGQFSCKSCSIYVSVEENVYYFCSCKNPPKIIIIINKKIKI